MANLDILQSSSDHLPLVPETITRESVLTFNSVKRDPESWAQSLPANQGLYLNENEKDSCGVGFICHIKGESSHKIVSDARQLLCAMTHRGATGADSRDGDGAGVMTSIPHNFFKREAESDMGCMLPEPGEYAVGNVFFKRDNQLNSFQSIFSKIATDLGLRVLGWREVPTDGTILGPAASSVEPAIFQPFVVLHAHYGDGKVCEGGAFDATHFERQLYVLRKRATHSMFVVFCSFVVLEESSNGHFNFPSHEVRLQKAFTSAPFPPRTSFTRGNYPPLKCTITIMISTMFSIGPILRWFILVSRPIHSLVGTAPNP